MPSQRRIFSVRPCKTILAAAFLFAAACPVAVADEAMSLRVFSQAVLRSDEALALRAAEVTIAAAGVRSARGAFEPVAFIRGNRDRYNVLNNAQERQQRALNSTYNSRTTVTSTGIGARTETGADVEVAYRIDRYRNNLQPLSVYGREYRSVLGLTASQPLLRGAGLAVNRAPTTIAEYEERIAREALNQAREQRLMDAVSAYVQRQEATERVRVLEGSLSVAEALLAAAERMTEGGMRPGSSVVEAVAFRDIRRVQLEQARQDVLDARTAMQQLVLLDNPTTDGVPQPRAIAPVLSLAERPIAIPASSVMLTQALAQRAELRIAALRVAREGVRIMVAENQALPQLNVTGRYDFDGLSDSSRSSVDRAIYGPNRAWGLGMELRVPLQGNRTAQAELAAARLRRDQADMSSNATRQRIVNDIEATHDAALLVTRQLENQRQLVRSQRELLRQAQLQAEGGRLSSIELLRRRLDLLLAEEQLITRRATVERATYTIAFITGRLATELGVE